MIVMAGRQPRRLAVAGEQLRVAGLLHRREIFLLAALMLGLGVLFAYATATAVVDLADAELHPGHAFLAGGHVPLLFLAALWPLGAWRREPPSRRGHFWAGPIARGLHTFHRLIASWLWLMVVTALYLTIIAVLALIYAPAEPTVWMLATEAISAVLGATIIYLLVSVLAIRLSHPGRWLAGIAFSWLFLFAAGAASGVDPLVDVTVFLYAHLNAAVSYGPENPTTAVAALALGLVGCAAAALSHQEPV